MTSTPSSSMVTYPPTSGAALPANFQTCLRTSARAVPDPRHGPLPVCGKGVDQAGDRRIAGHRPQHGRLGSARLGSARSMPTSARQSPPRATARAISSRNLPGSCTAQAFRQGANAADAA
jgi:hypothetical protein